MVVAVVGATKSRAKKLADDLGIDTHFTFGARNVATTIEGLRADRVLIEAEAHLPESAVATIHANVRKTPGGIVRYVSAWIPPQARGQEGEPSV